MRRGGAVHPAPRWNGAASSQGAGGGSLRGEQAVVIGLGASGRAAVAALLSAGATVRVSEARTAEELRERDALFEPLPSEVELHTGGHMAEHLAGATLVVVSPGVPEHVPVVVEALARGLPVWSELELGARLCRVPFVAVTGTNGKTTTTEMVALAMREAGLRARACGNVGYPFSTAALEEHDALAVEASSFQLRFCHTFHPRVSALLNLAEDHLDWHGTFEAYAAAKARIHARQGEGDVHVGNRDDPRAAEVSASAGCEVRWFRAGEPGPGEVGIVEGRVVARLGPGLEIRPRGLASGAFLLDAAAATAACLAFGLAPAKVGRALATATPGRHRGALVGTVGGVRFLDNSKATNPHAALAALEGLERVVLVAGGLDRGVDLGPLREAGSRLACVVAIGETAPQLGRVFAGVAPVRRAGSMEEAVAAAHAEAPPGGTVLLAPACASQDMFRDYRDRGERFARAVEALAARADREDGAAGTGGEAAGPAGEARTEAGDA